MKRNLTYAAAGLLIGVAIFLFTEVIALTHRVNELESASAAASENWAYTSGYQGRL